MENTVTERGTGRAILAAFFIALMIKLFIFDFVLTEGQSMSPTIQPGTVLMVDRCYYGLRFPWSERYLFFWAMPKEGDVVIFYTPMGDIAVKRCAGITSSGKFIALGDNSLQSYDSRSYGPIPIDNIIGKVLGN
ncbi:MAG: signal peptidase I [Treponema sp.]|jgi:signal peptidase I|nr:signal peptidase I [Treponema sp.]